jgi:type IV pilus assembly protein PilW
MDNAVINGASHALEGKATSGVHGSDVLAVHFSVSEDDGISGLLNCAGFSVTSTAVNGTDLGWSIFYLVPGSNGGSDLRCKYHGTNQWDSQALASGVVALQFLYGLDTDGDGLPNQFVNATTLAQIEDNHVSNQHPIAAVHIALVMQSETESPALSMPEAIDLFGAFYSEAHASDDPGVHLLLKDFPVNQKKRQHRLFERVVFLRKQTIVKDTGNAL